MAKKLEVIRNYLIITDTITLETVEFPQDRVRYKDYSTTIQFKYIDDSTQDVTYQFDELVDADEVAWIDLPTLLDWLQNNTGAYGALDVFVQDSTAPILIVKASNLIAETTVAVLAAKDDLIINVVDATGFVVGQYLTIFNADANRVYFGNVLAINTLAITLDTPIDFEYPPGSFISVGNTNMAVNGNVTPQIFGVRNPSGTDIPLKFDITRLIFTGLTDAAVDLSKFGDIIGGLVKGIVLRKVDGDYRNVFNAKTNAEMKNLMYDFDIQVAQGNQQDGFTGRITFAGQNKMGAVIRLSEDEDLQVVVQDDLSSLVSFTMIAEGSEVTD